MENNWISFGFPYELPTSDKNFKDSFCYKKLNRPGTLIEVDWGDAKDTYLIGELLPNGFWDTKDGNFIGSAIISKYKIVWEPGQD